jgi:hypothetical protein
MKRLPQVRWPFRAAERDRPHTALPRVTGRQRRERPRSAGAESAVTFATSPPRAAWRRWLLAMALFLLPIVVYWPTVFHRFGFRDDYSILREAHEEPGKVMRVCAMQARPLYGELMETSFRLARGIDDLAWIRFAGTLLLGVVTAVTFLLLRSLKWDRWTAALAAGLIAVLPSSQLIASWAVGWPLCVAILLTLGGFVSAEQAFAGRQTGGVVRPGSGRRWKAPGAVAWRGPGVAKVGWWTAAVVLVMGSALIYPSNTLFYFTAVAAAVWSRRRGTMRGGIEWFVRHAITVVIGLLMAFTLMMTAFASGVVPASTRVGLEHDWMGKLGWFVGEPLQNAMALIAHNHDGGSHAVHRVAALVATVIVGGLAHCCFNRRWRQRLWWTVGLAAMLPASFLVNLVVADRWTVYRVLLPLSATVVVLLAISLLTLSGRRLARAGLVLLLVPGLWLARRASFDLVARPQAAELRAMESGAAAINPSERPRIFVLTPTPEEHVAPWVFADEFGSLSTDSDWVPKEMLKLIMRDRFPDLPDIARQYTVQTGRNVPAQAAYDVVIDLRHLREMGR